MGNPGNSSGDGLIYDLVLALNERCPSEILEKINGLDENRTIRVSTNAFDDPYPDEPVNLCITRCQISVLRTSSLK